MTSNEEMIRKFAEAFDEAFGDECKAAYITVVPELGKGPLFDDLAKLFASNDWKPLGAVIDGEGPMLPDGCHAAADETDARNEERRHLERMLRTADRAYAARSCTTTSTTDSPRSRKARPTIPIPTTVGRPSIRPPARSNNPSH